MYPQTVEDYFSRERCINKKTFTSSTLKVMVGCGIAQQAMILALSSLNQT